MAGANPDKFKQFQGSLNNALDMSTFDRIKRALGLGGDPQAAPAPSPSPVQDELDQQKKQRDQGQY